MCVCSQASHVPLHLGAPPTELEVPLRVGVHAADSGHRRAVVVEARRAALARALELRRAVLARAVETAGGLASLGLGLGLGLGVGVGVGLGLGLGIGLGLRVRVASPLSQLIHE